MANQLICLSVTSFLDVILQSQETMCTTFMTSFYCFVVVFQNYINVQNTALQIAFLSEKFKASVLRERVTICKDFQQPLIREFKKNVMKMLK